MNRIGSSTLVFNNKPRVIGNYSIVGPKEGKGNFAQYFDQILDDDTLGEPTYEKAECRLLEQTVKNAIGNAKLHPSDIDFMLAGDLMNQITSSSFSARSLQIPYLGLFGACSTMAESLALGAVLVDGGFAHNVVCGTVSHFSSAEIQFRYPLELGTQRPPTSQWTTTASGATVLAPNKSGVAVTHATIGRVIDWDVSDVNNMGGAMAPAAFDTLMQHLNDLSIDPDYYDLILTGDLGVYGKEILIEYLKQGGIDISRNYNDCGLILYDRERQPVYAGASGPSSSALVFSAYIMKEMERGRYRKVLLVPTGAIFSPTRVFQGDSIPSIAHAIGLEVDE